MIKTIVSVALTLIIYIWGYILKKIRAGRWDFFFFFTFLYRYFFSIQKAYETLKQNLAKFKYTMYTPVIN